eukprot:Cvel_31761.t1-p1 / transcript=Cvel_31761.t1 / gene=Cvel_31761 / organism=Chromera_velia_CCMP2878 / gene_product=hypothetical protein / transcript_product=hypothetical protein / location=Cvel_scaffold4792:2269-2693(-) / protein_length=141 / sequence_SO=supercontig / SO=protein_coding / is_pseudo=false
MDDTVLHKSLDGDMSERVIVGGTYPKHMLPFPEEDEADVEVKKRQPAPAKLLSEVQYAKIVLAKLTKTFLLVPHNIKADPKVIAILPLKGPAHSSSIGRKLEGWILDKVNRVSVSEGSGDPMRNTINSTVDGDTKEQNDVH